MPGNAPQTSRHLEVERKFDVVESTVSPSFEGIAAVARVEQSPTQALDAVYFDTPGADLAAQPDHPAAPHRRLRRRLAPETARRARRPHRGPCAAGRVRPASRRRRARRVAGCGAGDRARPPAGTGRAHHHRTRKPDAVRRRRRRAGGVLRRPCHRVAAGFRRSASPRTSSGASGNWSWSTGSEWDRGPELLNRLSNRLLDAGAAPAGHGSKLARVLAYAGYSDQQAREPPTDPLHRAVAEQVDELLVWDRAVRADAYDSVHQMRVTTRKIRSLLQDSQDSFGLSDDAWILDELRELAGVLGVARDAEVLAERYERALDGLTPELVRGPVRERLVDGAERRYQSGLRRSLIAMRSQRYFRLLDALDALVPPNRPDAARRRGDRRRSPSTRPTSVSARPQRPPRRRRRGRPEAEHDTRRGTAPDPQARQATSLHRGGDRGEPGVRAGQDHPDAARRSSRQRGQPAAPDPAGRCRARRRRGHLHLRPALPAGGRLGRQLPCSSSTTRCASSTSRCAKRGADWRHGGEGRTSWPVSRILFRTAADNHGGTAATIHLDTPSPGASSGLPAGSGEQPSNACAAAPSVRPSWPCFGWGLPSHPGHPECWCALTAPFHPYHRERVAVCFLWHFPASHLGLPLAITLLCEVRTFLDSPHDEPRPPGQLVRDEHGTRCAMSVASGFVAATDSMVNWQIRQREERRMSRWEKRVDSGDWDAITAGSQRLRRGAAAAAGHAQRGGAAAQALHRRRLVPLDRRHGAQAVRRRAVSLLPGALPRGRSNRSNRRCIPGCCRSPGTGGPSWAGHALAGQPRRLAATCHAAGQTQVHRADAASTARATGTRCTGIYTGTWCFRFRW